jgi:quinohemoprotein ethanol dehydrogenase
LRFLTPQTHARFDDIVLKGIYQERGMASFADVLSPDDAAAVHAYLIARGNEDYADAAAKGN